MKTSENVPVLTAAAAFTARVSTVMAANRIVIIHNLMMNWQDPGARFGSVQSSLDLTTVECGVGKV